MIQAKHLAVVFLLGATAYLLGSQASPQQCTAIKVPESTNQSVWVNGKKTEAPTQISKAFVPILSTVELPRGFKAVGGGGGMVIACN